VNEQLIKLMAGLSVPDWINRPADRGSIIAVLLAAGLYVIVRGLWAISNDEGL